MPETTCCPDCGAELPTGATGGLCPRCLLGAGISSDSPFDRPADSPFAATTPQAGGFVPPTPESLAGYFPDLEVLEIIGQGGMGAVYKARQTKLDRLVALKIIRPESADDPAFAERFSREAKTLARLNHSNIVSIHDFGEIDSSHLAPRDVRHDVGSEFEGENEVSRHAERDDYGGRTLYFFVMEFVDGANLRQLMESGRLQPAQSMSIVPQVCDALQYAHDEGVVHRDIKPENILIDRRGRVKIADFGLAKLAGQSPENFTLTGTHQVMGTPRYMAPEQMSSSRLVDHRADIYSLGVVLYEMLTGELPMGRFEAPSNKAAVDARLDDVVHRALESNPDRRYQRASEIRTDMESIAFDAHSHGGLESIAGDGSIAGGFPGPSTIMERQVAGVVNWFKGGSSPAGETTAKVTATDRTKIRRKVRAPAIALMVYGVVLMIPGVLLFAHGTTEPWYIGVGKIAGALCVIGLCGLVIRGGWHLLTLDNHRSAVLGALLGQPVGIWGLTQVSRDDVRDAFITSASPPPRLSMSSLLNTLCGVLIAGGGVVMAFQPWAEIFNTANQEWFSAVGFAWEYGMVACVTLVLVGLFLLATAAVRPVPVWRPMLVALGAVVVLFCCGRFIQMVNDGTLAVRPLLDVASWGVEVDGQTPRTIGGWSGFVVQRHRAVDFLMLIGIGLLIVAAVDLRLALQPSPGKLKLRSNSDQGAPRFSRKAIVGACWAPFFFVGNVLLTVPAITLQGPNADSPPQLNLLLLIPASIVGFVGVLAPFGTTILGMLALSDIRHAPSRVRGLGLAYLDVIVFPLLVLDLILLLGVGLAVSSLFPAGPGEAGPSYAFLVLLGAPFCLILDAVIGIWGWRHVPRSVSTVSQDAARQPDSRPGGADSSRTTTTPAESSLSSLEVRRIEMRLKAPAAGLMVVALLGFTFWCVQGCIIIFDAPYGVRWTPSAILATAAASVGLLLLIGAIMLGALHLRWLTGVGWCYAAAILSIIPWSLASIVGIPVGIWVLKVLGDAEVKEAFVQRSLELERNRQ